jgi:UDP-N-acetyl-D-mannosaminuronate dehydrogenase
VPEVRLQVSPEFSSFEFHSALVSALADLDATVVGTEHPREKNISLQILKDGSPVMLVILDMRKSLQQQRKESSH